MKSVQDLYKIQFLLGLKLNQSIKDLEDMDFAEVKYLDEELAAFLKETAGG